MKILYYIQSMAGGGAARLLALLANELAKRDYEIVIATNTNVPVVYELDGRIRLLSLYDEASYSIGRFKRFFAQIRKARIIAKTELPDVIISMLPPVCFYTKLATTGLGTPIIFSDVTSYARKDSRFVHFVRYHFYNMADAVTIQTENDRKILGRRIPKKVVINNPLSYPIYWGDSKREKSILSIGHTSEWHIKGFDLLIKSFAKIADKHKDWIVSIAGTSTPESIMYLKNIIAENGLEGRINFIGFHEHIDEVMRSASIFALSSRIEGFSLSLIEALSQGCPAVSFKIRGVITDVTDNGHGTLLTEDYSIEEFSDNLDKLMSDESLRQKLADEGREFVKKYSIVSIVNQWEDLFKKLIDKN